MPPIERTGHSRRCERAERPPCVCSCGGAEHGWQGALAIAAAPSDELLRRAERKTEEDWAAAVGRGENTARGRGGPKARTAAGQHAAVKTFVVEVIRRLRDDRALYEATERLGQSFRISRDKDPDDPRRRLTAEEHERFIESRVILRLRREFGDQRIDAFQKQAAQTHFWCELLAQTARVLHECAEHYGQAKEMVLSALTGQDEPHPDGWPALLPEREIMERAVELVWTHLQRIAAGLALEDVFRLTGPIRVLAVLMCREPRRHPAVLEHCIKPIIGYAAGIWERAKTRLSQAFPSLWPPPDETAPEHADATAEAEQPVPWPSSSGA